MNAPRHSVAGGTSRRAVRRARGRGGHGLVRPVVWTLLLALGACSVLTPMDDEAAEALARARARWEAVGPEDYRYLVRRACECQAGTGGPFEVQVARGRAPVVIRPEDGRALEPPLSTAFPSVSGLFELVGDALDRGAHHVDVDYDHGTGVPLRIQIDYDERTADDELLYWSTVPEPLG